MTTKKRRLQDLYTVGRELALNDESGEEPVKVWLQKLSAIDAETAARKAGAAKARVLMESRREDSEEYGDAYSEMSNLPRESLIEIAIADDFGKAMQSAEAEVSSQDEWANDSYLQGLRDAWMELRPLYEDGDESHDEYLEARRVFDELKRYDALIDQRLDVARNKLRFDKEDLPTDELLRMAVDRNVMLRADTAWIREFRRMQIFLGVREAEDHKVRYFQTRSEVDQLSGALMQRLYDEFDRLNVDVVEGKDLPPTPTSAEQSERQGEAATEDFSGLTVVPQ